MPRFDTRSMLPQEREDFLEWVSDEPHIDPRDIVDDGRFSVHNGWISGNVFVRDEKGQIIPTRRNAALTRHFKVRQVHPLPPQFENWRH